MFHGTDDSVVDYKQSELLVNKVSEPKAPVEYWFTEGEHKAYLDWIYAAKKEETKVERIASMMQRLQRKLRLNDTE